MALWEWQHRGGSQLKSLNLTPVSFGDIEGWGEDNHADALKALTKSASFSESAGFEPRSLKAGLICDPSYAREYFERSFSVFLVGAPPRTGLLTGYFEPELEAALAPSQAYCEPVYSRPADLVLAGSGAAISNQQTSLTAGRLIDGELQPYFTRREIEAGALSGQNLEIAYAGDPIDLFVMHVQGGGVLHFADGPRRVTFAGKNGHPYTSIAKLLIERGELDAGNSSLDTLLQWLRSDLARARALMRENASYIFFEMLPESADAPRGSLGAPLTPGRSLAIDPGFHTPGLPIWVSAPDLAYGGTPFARLMVAQDTGSAIRGEARGDVFCGTGEAAGRIAGRIKHNCTFFVLIPKSD